VELATNPFAGEGGVVVGGGGTGSLTVHPGGTLTAVGTLTSGDNLANAIVLGGAAAGTANVTVGAAELNGTTQIYSNANVVSNDTVAFGANGAHTWHINGASAAQLAATGAATLGGSFFADFGGVNPSPGMSWGLIEAASVNGAFNSVQSSASLPLGQSLFTSVAPSANGELLSLNLQEVLVLNVDRNSGVAEIMQPGANTIELDGYSILSTQGTLVAESWNSLADQGGLGGGWTESNPTANALSELKASGVGSVATGNVISLGAAYDSLGGDFGFTGEDLTFIYTSPDGSTSTGIVNITGTRVNNLLLQIDPSNGEATLRNPSNTAVDIDGYIISSSNASLASDQWNSLEDQGAAGGDWLEFLNASDSQIGEFKATEATTLDPLASLSLGPIFDLAGDQDVVFEYIVDGAIEASLGVVAYEAPPTVTADFDGSGVVDGNDFTILQRNWNMPGGHTEGDANNDGVVDSLDLDAWESQFGLSASSQSAATAVPEPTTWALALVAMSAVAATRRRRLARRQ